MTPEQDENQEEFLLFLIFFEFSIRRREVEASFYDKEKNTYFRV